MTKLHDEQLRKIEELEIARIFYAQFEEDLAIEVADRKWEAKETIRNLVREARKAGVPYSRIGTALQTSDHATLKSYEKDIRRDTR